MDEVVIPIIGRKYWLRRAVDANGDVLDILIQPQRYAKAANRHAKSDAFDLWDICALEMSA